MMKNLFFTIVFFALTYSVFAQNTQVYNTKANAKQDIEKAITIANKEGKHVFLQIGGNWCPWCIKFHNFLKADEEITAFVEKNYEVVKVNYDQENKQEELLAKFGYPQRFGFPVFVVFDGKGNRIHTQNSAFLEKDKNYDKDVVMRFFKNWSPTALNPDSYKK